MATGRKDKTRIKFLYVFKPTKRMKSVSVSILTDDNQYFEHLLELRTSKMTKYVGRRIRSLFESFIIDKNTSVLVNSLIDENHLMYQYLMFLRQHIGFKLLAVPIDKMTKKVYFFFGHGTAKKKIPVIKAWQMIIDSKSCPWITQSIEWKLQNKTEETAQRIRISRLAMFYIALKSYSHIRSSRQC